MHDLGFNRSDTLRPGNGGEIALESLGGGASQSHGGKTAGPVDLKGRTLFTESKLRLKLQRFTLEI